MRGEYQNCYIQGDIIQELPPHARRIPTIAQVAGQALGTTSACAENTPDECHNPHRLQNYLRMRGEYAGPALTAGVLGELPPHARRIPHGNRW